MNKLFNYIFLVHLFMFTACMSTGVKVGQESQPGINVPKLNQKEASSLVADNTVWIIQSGLKGEAGLFSENKALPVKSLKVDLKIIEFLASVDISVSYSQVTAGKKLLFKYPAFYGMLVRDFRVNVGGRKFRAIISERESAEEIFKLAKKQGFNAVIVSQKAFSDMVVEVSRNKRSDISVDFEYTQLSSVQGKQRVLALPDFPGLENGQFNLSVSGRFSSELTSFSGLGKKIVGKQFVENIKDIRAFDGGLLIKYSIKEMQGLSSDKRKVLSWDEETFSYREKGSKFLYCDPKITGPAFAFLNMQKMLREGRSFKEVQEYALQSRLLTPLTKFLLVDSIK